MEPNLKESIRRILSVPKIKSSGLSIDDITTHVKNEISTIFSESPDFETLKKKVNSILLADVKRKSGNEFSKVKNQKTGSYKKGYYKIKTIKPENPLPPATSPDIVIPSKQKTDSAIPNQNTTFIGKAGECAVMSELLFRGFNSNIMMVDDGVDIVASKNNMYYFIQVKSTTIRDNGKIQASIKTDRFEAFINAQIRYIIVARCKMYGIDTNLYFIFNNKDIDQFIYKKIVHMNENAISIKIRIDEKDGNKPYLYHDGKEEEISFFMNNFNI